MMQKKKTNTHENIVFVTRIDFPEKEECKSTYAMLVFCSRRRTCEIHSHCGIHIESTSALHRIQI